MKFPNFKNYKHRRIAKTVLIATTWAFIFTQCFNITEVEQPIAANAGEMMTIVVNAEVLEDLNNPGANPGGSELVFGFMAPKSWNVAENATVTVNSSPFSQQLVLMNPEEIQPNSDPAVPWVEDLENRVGFGANYGEMEWVMYEATEPYQPQFPELPLRGTITVEVVVGADNLITQLGYFIGDNEWGIWDFNDNFDFFFTDCMEVINGQGEIIDLCGDPPGPSTVEITPSTFGWNDILHVRFDASSGEGGEPTRLAGASSVFWCATALLQDGSTIDICTPSDVNSMAFEGNDIWSLTLWPADFFELEDANEIVSVSYNFTNDAQNIVVTDPSTGADFFLQSNCN